MRRLMAQPPCSIGGLFGVNTRKPIAFRDRDHGERNATHGSALAWVDRILAEHGINDARGEVILQTFPAVFGYAFKPVSFWFCYTNNEAPSLRAVVVEVHNTFGEQHTYLLHHQDGSGLHNGETLTAHKQFHVSPFLPVRGEYRFRWFLPKLPAKNHPTTRPKGSESNLNRCVVRIDYYDALHRPTHPDTVTLTTSISGKLCAMTLLSNLKVLFSFPWQSISVVLKIHWQAAKLWVKRVRFYSLPALPKHTVTLSIQDSQVGQQKSPT